MTTIDLAALGISREDLINRIVDKAAEDLFTEVNIDEDGDEWRAKSAVAKQLDALIKQRIDERVTALADAHVLPNVTAYIETLTLQETNRWGEKTGQKLTFIEYLAERADAYMREDVNFQGKTKDQDSYNWRKNTTRIAYMVHEHLQYSIESAMKQALATANSSIVGGLEAAVKTSLGNVLEKLKVEVKTK